MSTPLVSVITPLYNHERFIAGMIESVLSQDYQQLELIVVDDGSSDAGPEIVANWPDPRVKLLRQARNGYGVARALNTAIAAARGEFILWLSSDDYLLPGAISRAVSALSSGLAEDPMLALVYTNSLYESAEADYLASHCPLPASEQAAQLAARGAVRWPGPQAPNQHLLLNLMFWCPIYACCSLIRKAVYSRLGGFYSSWALTHDYEMWQRILLAGYRARLIPGAQAVQRMHAANKGHYVNLVPAETKLVNRLGRARLSAEQEAGLLRHLELPAERQRLWWAEEALKHQLLDSALYELEAWLAAGHPLERPFVNAVPQMRALLSLPPARERAPDCELLIALTMPESLPWRLIAVLTHYFKAFDAGARVRLGIWLDPAAGAALEAACEARIEGILSFLGRSRASLPDYAYLRDMPLAAASDAAACLLPIGSAGLLEQQLIFRFRSQGKPVLYHAEPVHFQRVLAQV